MIRIGMLGECMIELNGEPFKSIKQSYGGDTLNTAVYLSRCIRDNTSLIEAQISYITAVGNDLLSQKLVEQWENEKIDTQFVLRSPTRQCGLYFIQVDTQGERSFNYWRNDSAAKYLFTEFDICSQIKKLSQLDYVLISGISLAILPDQDKSKLISLLSVLKQSGTKILFDNNFRPKLWQSSTVADIQQWYERIYTLTDIALVTEDDENAIFGSCSHDSLVDRLHHYGIHTVIVKLGADGCLLSKPNDIKQYIKTEPIKRVIDTTSAGDSFNAGFIYSLMSQKSLVEACEFGNYVAGIVIQHPGALIDKAISLTAQTQ